MGGNDPPDATQNAMIDVIMSSTHVMGLSSSLMGPAGHPPPRIKVLDSFVEVPSGATSERWARDIRRTTGLTSHQHRRATGHRAQARWTEFSDLQSAIDDRKKRRSDLRYMRRQGVDFSDLARDESLSSPPALRSRIHPRGVRGSPAAQLRTTGNGGFEQRDCSGGGLGLVARERRSTPQPPT